MKKMAIVLLALATSTSCTSNEAATDPSSDKTLTAEEIQESSSRVSPHGGDNHARAASTDAISPTRFSSWSSENVPPSGTDIVCESWHFRTDQCCVNFPIGSASLVEQYSRTPCDSVHWQYSDNCLTVLNGCRGMFHADPKPDFTGKLYPKYYVMTVMYAPPGASSTVDYLQGTSFGSTTSIKHSWGHIHEVKASALVKPLDFMSIGLSVTSSKNTAEESSSSYDIKSTTQTDFSIGGFQDIVNHDLDRIYLWLNPQVDIAVYGDQITWALSTIEGQIPLISYVNVIWLRDPSTMPSNVASLLRSANIGPDDYAQILSVDPFANGATTIDPARFLYQTNFPYVPVGVHGQNPTPTRYAISKISTSGSTTSSSLSYSVGTSASHGLDFLKFLQLNLAVSDTMTWTHGNTFSTSAGSTVSAAATIMQPPYGYTGSTRLMVYLDTVFNTFLFALQ